MKRVVGIGGVFFKAKDPEKLRTWYRDHLGFNLEEWGGAIFQPSGSKDADGTTDTEKTVWSLFPSDSDYFAPSTQAFMINYRVDDLHALLAQLRQEGCAVDAKVDESEFGKFGWVMDPEGNRVELWQPPGT
ncbi:VOC family protein [Undibacterium sp. CY18W]|uniref:VOC family protein n=1 Tax=Undibacterium hunanense TaxID=2762292 RepID=A0ABR6ZY94_9BURK|nr:VOC family protein [Undibacterium hunanense]MBC3920833.1 VOC family protein [Undibacterium hunanense]